MLLLLHAIIPFLYLNAAPCFCEFWHYHPYTSFNTLYLCSKIPEAEIGT